MAGAIDASLRKFHASLNVSDLDRSIAFYRVLLGRESFLLLKPQGAQVRSR